MNEGAFCYSQRARADQATNNALVADIPQVPEHRLDPRLLRT